MTDARHTEHDDIAELLVPYALGLLGDSDRELVRQALTVDPALRSELASIEATGAQLVASMPRVAAPASLKSRVFDALPAESRTADLAAVRAAKSARRPWHRRFAMPALAGGLAVACLVLAVVAINLSGELSDTQTSLDEARTASDSQMPLDGNSLVSLTTKQGLADAKGMLVPYGDHYLLMLTNVPPPGEGHSWQIWTRDKSGIVRNAGMWDGDSSDQMLVVEKDDIREVMISHEPSVKPAPAPSGAAMATVLV